MIIKLKSGLIYNNAIKATFKHRKPKGFFKKSELLLVVALDIGEEEPYEVFWSPELIESIEKDPTEGERIIETPSKGSDIKCWICDEKGRVD